MERIELQELYDYIEKCKPKDDSITVRIAKAVEDRDELIKQLMEQAEQAEARVKELELYIKERTHGCKKFVTCDECEDKCEV